MYVIKYSNFKRQWLVINLATGIAHSGWSSRLDADKAKRTLNLMVNK